MRAVATRATHPKLFTWEDYSEDPSVGELTADAVANNEFAKAETSWLGVRKLIQEDYTWNEGCVIEGDDILPHLVARDFLGSNVVKAVFVGDSDADRIRTTVLARGGLWDVEKEVEWVLKFSERVRSEAERHGFAWVDLEKNDRDVVQVLGALGLRQQ